MSVPHDGRHGDCGYFAAACMESEQPLPLTLASTAAAQAMRRRVTLEVIGRWEHFSKFDITRNRELHRLRIQQPGDERSDAELYEQLMTTTRSTGWRSWADQIEVQAMSDLLGLGIVVVDVHQLSENKGQVRLLSHTPAAEGSGRERFEKNPRFAVVLYSGSHFELLYKSGGEMMFLISQLDDARLQNELVVCGTRWFESRHLDAQWWSSDAAVQERKRSRSHSQPDFTPLYQTDIVYEAASKQWQPSLQLEKRQGFSDDVGPTVLEAFEQALAASGKLGDHQKLAQPGSTEAHVRRRMLLKLELDQQAVDGLFRNATAMLSLAGRGVPSEDAKQSAFRVQVIGDVQSGKSEQMVAVIAKAVDQGYHGCVVFSGVQNALRTQTQKRLDYYFENQSHLHSSLQKQGQDSVQHAKDMGKSSQQPWVWLTNGDDITNTAAISQRSAKMLNYLREDNSLIQHLRQHRSTADRCFFLAVIKKSAPALMRYYQRVVKQLANQPPGEVGKILYLDDESDDRSLYGTRRNRCRQFNPSEPPPYTPPMGTRVAILMHDIIGRGVVNEQLQPGEVDEDEETDDEDEEVKIKQEEQEHRVEPTHLHDEDGKHLLDSLMVRFTATPQANLFERKDSPLFPHALWLMELPRNNSSYHGLERWFRSVPASLLYPAATRDNMYNLIEELATRSQAEQEERARTPLQTIPYCDWHNWGPSNTVRINGVVDMTVQVLPIVTRSNFGRIEQRQKQVLKHILNADEKSGLDSTEIPDRLPPSMIQALIDFLLTGAVYRWRKTRQQQSAASPREEVVEDVLAFFTSRKAALLGFAADQRQAAARFGPALLALSSLLLSPSQDSASSLSSSSSVFAACVRDVAFFGRLPWLSDSARPDVDAVGEVIELLDTYLAKLSSGGEKQTALRLAHHCAAFRLAFVGKNPQQRLQWMLPERKSEQATFLAVETRELGRHMLSTMRMQVAFLVLVETRTEDGEASWELRRLDCSPSSSAPTHYVLVWREQSAGEERYLCLDASHVGAALAARLAALPLHNAARSDRSAARVTDRIDLLGRNLSENERKLWHAAFFQLSSNLENQALITDVLDQSWFKVTTRLRPWLARRLAVDEAVVNERQQGESEPALDARVRLMFPETQRRLQKNQEEIAKAVGRKLGGLQHDVDQIGKTFRDWQDKLLEWRRECEQLDPESGKSEAAVIDALFDAQWTRLSLRMQHVQSQWPVNERQPVPQLADLVLNLGYVANRAIIRRGNRNVTPVVKERKLLELDYLLSEDNSLPIPENLILVGSNSHTRGITIQGLRVSYYGRSTKFENTDITIQMARWCGHKTLLERDLITLFIQERSACTFMALALYNHLMRLSVKTFISAGRNIATDPLVLYNFRTMQLSTMTDSMVMVTHVARQMTNPAVEQQQALANFLRLQAFVEDLDKEGIRNRTCIGEQQGAQVYLQVRPTAVADLLAELHTQQGVENQCLAMRQTLVSHQLLAESSRQLRDVIDIVHVVVLPIIDAPLAPATTAPKTVQFSELDLELVQDGRGFLSPALFDAQSELKADLPAIMMEASGRHPSSHFICGQGKDWFEFAAQPSLFSSFDDDEVDDERVREQLDYSKPCNLQRRKTDAPHLLIISRYRPSTATCPQSVQSAQRESACETFYLPALCYIASESSTAGSVVHGMNRQLEFDEVGLSAAHLVMAQASAKIPRKRSKRQLQSAARVQKLGQLWERLDRSTLTTLTRYALFEPAVERNEWIQRKITVTDDTDRDLSEEVGAVGRPGEANPTVRDVLLKHLWSLAVDGSLWLKWNAVDDRNPYFEPLVDFTAADPDARDAVDIAPQIEEDFRAASLEWIDRIGSYPVSLYLVCKWLVTHQYETLKEVDLDMTVLLHNWRRNPVNDKKSMPHKKSLYLHNQWKKRLGNLLKPIGGSRLDTPPFATLVSGDGRPATASTASKRPVKRVHLSPTDVAEEEDSAERKRLRASSTNRSGAEEQAVRVASDGVRRASARLISFAPPEYFPVSDEDEDEGMDDVEDPTDEEYTT